MLDPNVQDLHSQSEDFAQAKCTEAPLVAKAAFSSKVVVLL